MRFGSLLDRCISVAVSLAVLGAHAMGQAPAAGAVPAATAVPVAGGVAATASGTVASARERLAAVQLAVLPEALASLGDLDLAAHGFVRPLEGRLSSAFGWRNISVNGNRFHAGVDFVASMGTPVAAARDGIVTRSGWWGTYGYVVVLDHGDGSETRYAHLSRLAVAAGDAVRQGDLVGAVGSTGASTGPHLHFELRFDGRAVDPLNYLSEAR